MAIIMAIMAIIYGNTNGPYMAMIIAIIAIIMAIIMAIHGNNNGHKWQY